MHAPTATEVSATAGGTDLESWGHPFGGGGESRGHQLLGEKSRLRRSSVDQVTNAKARPSEGQLEIKTVGPRRGQSQDQGQCGDKARGHNKNSERQARELK